MNLTPEKLNYYLGHHLECFFGYANDENIRNGAASGGITSLLLMKLFDEGKIQGAVITKTIIDGGKLVAKNYIATTKEEILDSRSSVYIDFDFWEILEEVRNFQGKLAIVALPCQIGVLRKIMDHDAALKEKIFCLVGLFCGHISRAELINEVLRKNKIDVREVRKFIFRSGHWRGQSRIIFKDNRELSFNFKKFSIYQNLFFYSSEKCLFCKDHTAETADVSLGDVWTKKMKENPIKHNVLIARDNWIKDYLVELSARSELVLKPVNDIEVFKAQKRSLIYHKHSNARSIAGRFFGYNIEFDKNAYNLYRWNDILSASFVILNTKLSKNASFKKIIFRLPEKIWLPYLYLMKILINF